MKIAIGSDRRGFETKNKLELVTDGMCEECFDHYIPEVCDSDLDLELE